MAWRAMTAEEMVSRPEARLEGSLLLIVVCAATLAVACVIALLFALMAIPTVLSGGSAGGFFSTRGPAGLGLLYAVPTLYLMGWALAFSILTLMRSPLAPGFAAGGLVGWLGVRLLIGIGGQFLLANQYSGGPGFILQSLLPMLISLVGELMLVAGFWIYMRDGVRPNGYFRRLIQA